MRNLTKRSHKKNRNSGADEHSELKIFKMQ